MSSSAVVIDPKLFELLACPACDDHPALRLEADTRTLHCDACNQTYPIDQRGFVDLTVGSQATARDKGATA